MAALFVDLENVQEAGLTGYMELIPTDILNIFYSDACPNMNLQILNTIKSSGCKWNFIKLATPGKNALDFYVSTALGETLGADPNQNVSIISKDKGFQFVVDYWRQHEPTHHITIAPTILMALKSMPGEEDKERRARLHKETKSVSIEQWAADEKQRAADVPQPAQKKENQKSQEIACQHSVVYVVDERTNPCADSVLYRVMGWLFKKIRRI